MNNASYHHLVIGILVASTSVSCLIGCGNTGSGGASSADTAGTGTAGTGAGGMASSSGSATGGSGGSGGGAPGTPPYLVSIDHWASPSRLLKIDVQTGAGKVACTLPASVDDVNYHSLTFDQNGVLYASNSKTATLDIIDPCTCEVTSPFPMGVSNVPGISSDQNGHIYGIETTSNKLVEFDFMSGAFVPIASLNAGFTSCGAGWSDKLYGGMGGLWAINGQDNSLNTIKLDGMVTNVGTIGMISFAQSVGVEMHPANGAIYACTTDTVLYQIDPINMHVQKIGNGMGHTKTCNNLAAPWVPIACLDAL